MRTDHWQIGICLICFIITLLRIFKIKGRFYVGLQLARILGFFSNISMAAYLNDWHTLLVKWCVNYLNSCFTDKREHFKREKSVGMGSRIQLEGLEEEVIDIISFKSAGMNLSINSFGLTVVSISAILIYSGLMVGKMYIYLSLILAILLLKNVKEIMGAEWGKDGGCDCQPSYSVEKESWIVVLFINQCWIIFSSSLLQCFF